MLARAPSAIEVGFVIRTLDGPLAPIACASRTAYRPCKDCTDVRGCAVRITMGKVRDAMAEILDRMTVADMLAIGGGRQGRADVSRPTRRRRRIRTSPSR